MVIKANVQKNPALGVDLKQGGGSSVTNENIINALGYTPANEADIPTKVSQLENDEKYVKNWEELPDKPFYIEEEVSSVTETLFEHEILDSANVPLSGVFYRYNFAENLNLNIEENAKYTLIVNGVEHEASEIDTHNKTLNFANVQIGSLATTLSIIQTASKTQIAYRVGSYGTYTLDVSLYSNEKTQIVHPLPEMFLPVHSHEWYDLPLTDDDKIPAIYLPETMGTAGVGIESIEQTTTSTEDDGNNVITVTLTNGKQYNFTVQNGSKGSPGEKGDPGAPGNDGEDGEDGFSPKIVTWNIEGGKRISITTKLGTEYVDIMHGKDATAGSADFSKLGVNIFNTLEWDGNAEGLIYATGSADDIVRISGCVPTQEDFEKGWTAVGVDGATVTGSGLVVLDKIFTTENGEFLVVPEDNIVSGGLTYPKKGIYVFDGSDASMFSLRSLTINEYTFIEGAIKTELLPKHLQFGEKITYGDTLTWDGVLAGHELVSIPTDEEGLTNYYIHVSDLVPTMEDLQNGATVIGEQQGTQVSATLPADQLTETDTYITDENMMVFVAKEDNVDVNGMVFPKKGIYWMYAEYNTVVMMAFYSLTIPGYGMFKHTEIETIPVEYLPSAESTRTYFWISGDKLNVNDGSEGFWTPATYRDIDRAYKKGQIIISDGGKDYMPVSVGLVPPYMAEITIIDFDSTGAIPKMYRVGSMD